MPSNPRQPAHRLPISAWLTLAWLAWWFLAGAGHPIPSAQAGMLVRPSLSVGAGYDSNVRLRQEPVGDAYLTVTPGLGLEAGPPENKLTVSGQVRFVQYQRHRELSQFDGGNLTVGWQRRLSEVTTFQASNAYSATYDQAELDDAGQLVQVRSDSGRRDRNTTSLRLQHLLGERSSLFVGYAYSVTTGTSESVENAVYHRADLGWQQALGVLWRMDLTADASHDDYQRTSDVNRGGVSLRLARLFSSISEGYVVARPGTVRSLSDDSRLRSARSYDTYAARVGYKSQLTQRLNLDISAGGTLVEGDEQTNSASGSVYPTGDLSLTYRGPNWQARLLASATLGEYDVLGQNSGLTDTRRVGASLVWTPLQHWRFFSSADLVFDDYKQQGDAAGTLGAGDVESARVTAMLSRQLSRHWWASLEYVFLVRDAELDKDDREQNRVLLTINTEWPMRW